MYGSSFVTGFRMPGCGENTPQQDPSQAATSQMSQFEPHADSLTRLSLVDWWFERLSKRMLQNSEVHILNTFPQVFWEVASSVMSFRPPGPILLFGT